MALFVCGATGKQGGAVVDALLASGRSDRIRALTRNPDSVAAMTLSRRGIELVKGDLSDGESLTTALKGVAVAYLVTDPSVGKAVEIAHGRSFVEAAQRAAVSHVVFSSVCGADVATDVDHFSSKGAIEDLVRQSGMGWTFLRPSSFMENIPDPGIGRFFFLGVMSAVFGNSKIHHIAVEDIGKCVAKAMLRPDAYNGRVLDLVGQIANTDEVQRALDRGDHRQNWRAWLPRWLIMLLLPYEFKQMFKWLSMTYEREEMPGTVAELKEIVPDALDIEAWESKQKLRRNANLANKRV